jgi:TadE-like protein
MIQENVGARMEELGVAMLELVLCVPLVVLLFLATLEIAQLLRVTQLANVLSREAGNVAFRLCADFAEPSGMEATQSRSADCLQQVLTGPDGAQTLADSLGLPFDAEIIVSIYRFDDTPNPGTPSLWLVSQIDGCPQCAIGTSKFSLAQGQIIGPNVAIPASEVAMQTHFVVSEVYVRYSKMTPDAFNQFIPSDGQGHAIYYEQTTF